MRCHPNADDLYGRCTACGRTWEQDAQTNPVADGLRELADLIDTHPEVAQAVEEVPLVALAGSREEWLALATVLRGDDQTTEASEYVTHLRSFGPDGAVSLSVCGAKAVVEPEVARG